MAYLQSSNGEKDLIDVLANHLVSEVIPSSLFRSPGKSNVLTNFGVELSIEYLAEGSATINGAAVLTFDVLASNGILHVIDSVLIPPDFVELEEAYSDLSGNLPKTASQPSTNHGAVEDPLGEVGTGDKTRHGSEHDESEIEFGSGSHSRIGISQIADQPNPVIGNQQMHLRRGLHFT